MHTAESAIEPRWQIVVLIDVKSETLCRRIERDDIECRRPACNEDMSKPSWFRCAVGSRTAQCQRHSQAPQATVRYLYLEV